MDDGAEADPAVVNPLPGFLTAEGSCGTIKASHDQLVGMAPVAGWRLTCLPHGLRVASWWGQPSAWQGWPCDCKARGPARRVAARRFASSPVQTYHSFA
jgi:hypothetical protein